MDPPNLLHAKQTDSLDELATVVPPLPTTKHTMFRDRKVVI